MIKPFVITTSYNAISNLLVFVQFLFAYSYINFDCEMSIISKREQLTEYCPLYRPVHD